MKTNMLTRARQHFNSEFVSREVNRANQLKWVRAIRALGDRWVYAQYVARKEARA